MCSPRIATSRLTNHMMKGKAIGRNCSAPSPAVASPGGQLEMAYSVSPSTGSTAKWRRSPLRAIWVKVCGPPPTNPASARSSGNSPEISETTWSEPSTVP